MIYLFKKFLLEEGAAGEVEYALLIGTLGFAMYAVWKWVRNSLLLSYGTIWYYIHKPEFP